jgi:hypothetical protein
MDKSLAELVKRWRVTASARLAKDPEDTVGQSLLKCANDLDFASRTNRALVGAAILAGSLLFSEAILPHSDEWRGREVCTLAPRPEFPIPADHTEQEGQEEQSFNVLAPAVSGENATSHTVSSSALLSFESLRRVERPFVFWTDFDYAILNPARQETGNQADVEGEKQQKSDLPGRVESRSEL